MINNNIQELFIGDSFGLVLMHDVNIRCEVKTNVLSITLNISNKKIKRWYFWQVFIIVFNIETENV